MLSLSPRQFRQVKKMIFSLVLNLTHEEFNSIGAKQVCRRAECELGLEKGALKDKDIC